MPLSRFISGQTSNIRFLFLLLIAYICRILLNRFTLLFLYKIKCNAQNKTSKNPNKIDNTSHTMSFLILNLSHFNAKIQLKTINTNASNKNTVSFLFLYEIGYAHLVIFLKHKHFFLCNFKIMWV